MKSCHIRFGPCLWIVEQHYNFGAAIIVFGGSKAAGPGKSDNPKLIHYCRFLLLALPATLRLVREGSALGE